jgi:DNA-directed RNA polymerase subunit RPC12/RpoP
MIPTNVPEELAKQWNSTCNFMCSECSKSVCLVTHHMPYWCECGHKRMAHHADHPHPCKDKDSSCECEAISFMTPQEALAQMLILIVTIEAIQIGECR